MAKKTTYKSLKRKRKHKKGARTNKRLLAIIISIIAIVCIGIGGLWFFVEYRGAERNVKAGDALFLEGSFNSAKKQYGRAVRKEPSNTAYVEKLQDAILAITPSTPVEARSAYDDYVRTLVHEARYSPLDINSHLQLTVEMYNAANLSGSLVYWRQLQAVTQTGLDRISLNDPRRYELLLYMGLASLRIEDASMTDTYDTEGNVRFPGEDEFEEVLDGDPGNAIAWSALAHGRMAVYYRLNDEGKTSQAAVNKIFANDTLAKAREVAGDSFEVAAVVLRELLLQRTTLLQLKQARPEEVTEEQLDVVKQKITVARDKVAETFEPESHFARTNELATLFVASGNDGLEEAINLLQATITLTPNDYGHSFTLSNYLIQADRIEEAEELLIQMLFAENQTTSLHAVAMFQMRPLVAHSLALLTIGQATQTEDEDVKRGYIEASKKYREELNSLLSGNEEDVLLLQVDGVIALAEERYVIAAKKLEDAIYRNPDVPSSVYRQSAIALSKTNALGIAIERLEKAIEKEPNVLANYIVKARMELQLSDAMSAEMTLSVLPESVRSREDVSELLTLIAMQTSNTNQVSFADPVMQAITEAFRLTENNNYSEAISSLENKIQQIEEQDWRLFAALSNIYRELDDKENAIIWIQKAIEIAPNKKLLLPSLHALKTNDRVEAYVSLINARGNDEKDTAEQLAVGLYELSVNFLGESNRWLRIGNGFESKKALEISNHALEESKKYQKLASDLGADMSRIFALEFFAAISDRDFEKAEIQLEHIINSSTDEMQVDSLRVSLNVERARVAQEEGKSDQFKMYTGKALALAEKMVEENRITDVAWSALGQVYALSNDYAEATGAYAEAYRIAPNKKSNIRQYVGVLGIANKDPARMLRILRQAQKQFPADIQIQTAWLDAEGQFGQPSRVLAFRHQRYAAERDDIMNALELAFGLLNMKPTREMLLDDSGIEVYTSRAWEQLPIDRKKEILTKARKRWDKQINEILEYADGLEDASIRTAFLHASIHRNLGQLDMASEIWDRYLEYVRESDQYTSSVIAAADFLNKSGRPQQAIFLLENARESQGERFEIDATLGTLFYRMGAFGKAAEYLKSPVEATENSILYTRMIESLAMAGQFEEAEMALDQYKSTNTAYSEAMLKALISRVRSEQMLAQGDISRGTAMLRNYRNALREAIGIDSTNPIPYIRLCRSLLNEYRITQKKSLLEEALLVADEAKTTGKSTEQFVIVQADAYQANGQLTRSINHLSRFLADNPTSTMTRQRLIEAFLDSNDVNRALRIAEEGIEVDPMDASWYQKLGDLHIRANDDKNEGVSSYLEAIQRKPSVQLLMRMNEMTRTEQAMPDQKLLKMASGPLAKLHPIVTAIKAKSLNNLGQNRDALLAMEKSWRLFKEAIQNGWIPPQSITEWFLDLQILFNDNPSAGEMFVKELTQGELNQFQLAGLAGYYHAFGDEYIEQALGVIDVALAEPNSVTEARLQLLMLRGTYLVGAKRYEESKQVFELLASESKSPLVQNNLAYVVGVYLNNPAEGLEIAKRAVKSAPRIASIVDTVAEMYRRLGQYQKAAETLDYLLQLDPANSKAMAKLSLLYSEHLGDPQRGVVFAERGRSQNPRSPEVLDALGWGYYRMGKSEHGEDSIRRSLRQGDTMNAYLHLAQIVTDELKFEEALGHIRMAQELAEDEFSMNSIQALKDDIRKKKAETQQ